jgi:hypothetical protein
MELLLVLLTELIKFVGDHFIKGIFVSVALVLFAQKIFREKINTTLAIQMLRWTIVLYSWLLLLCILSFWIMGKLDWNTYLGSPYQWTYWTMLFFNTAIPLLLLSEKLGQKGIVVFLVSLLMNAGWLFESYVVHITHIHRDYADSEGSIWMRYASEWTIVGKGILVGLIAITISYFTERRSIEAK